MKNAQFLKPEKTKNVSQSWPYFDDDEIEAVAEVLRSGKVNQWTGERVREFENKMASRFCVPHAIALSNGSVALELALKALGIGEGDEVIVTSRSFIASASCVPLVQATPVFADVDKDTQNITAETIAPLITERTKAIIPVHLAGWPCDMAGIMSLAKRHNLLVIEDCAQAVGAEIGGQPVGSFGDAATFSFCQDKIITTGGEGGMVFFKNEEHYVKAWSQKDHGKSLVAINTPTDEIGFRWIHESLGTNMRMTEMQAAIGLVQFGKLDRWLEARARNAKVWLDEFIQSSALRVPMPSNNIRHAFYKFYAFVIPEKLKPEVTRDTILGALNEAKLPSYTGSCPEIYREKAFAYLNVSPRPIAQELGETSLMFEVHPTLNHEDLQATARKVREVIEPFIG